ncbi:MAG: hypothetical protein CO118_05185 [Flavobacteriales bacterium CG_4_9_14_3_um_filter_32_8]|nr:MAG: hypothetical protein CO118_05185 [Flavobacteriales bacterium CG_4_9_14_3_um_filter_32_8]
MKILMKATNQLFLITTLCLLILSSCGNISGLEKYNGEQVCLKSVEGKFLSERRNENNNIKIVGENPNEWETFIIERKENGVVNIKTKDGFYISFNNNDSTLVAFASEPSYTESFILKPYKEYYSLNSVSGKPFSVDDEFKLRVAVEGDLFLFKFIPIPITSKSVIHLGDINFLRFFLQLIAFLIIIFLIYKCLLKDKFKNALSIYVYFIICFTWGYAIVHNENWKTDNVITNDSIIYYEYLPAALIFNDLSFDFIDSPPKDFNGTIWVNDKDKQGNRAPKYTYGLSILYLPFFLIGHLFAYILGYTTYGYSTPYFVLICFSSWFYAVMGMLYLRKTLLLLFNDTVVGFTLISIALATNLFHYVVQDSAMTHTYSFFLFSAFIWHTIKWHKRQNIKTTAVLGLLIGLISIIRPTNVILALVFVLYDVTSFDSLKEKTKLFWKYKNHVLLIVILSIMIWIPQFIFWKYLTNNWLYFSYQKEGFFFNNPQIFNGLFSYRKGWLVYTPIMIFAILGVFFLIKEHKKWVLPIAVFLILNIYIIYSWWCWWYGGGYGSRPMIESYSLMAIPLAAFFAYFDKMTSYLRSVSLFVVFIAVSLNLFQTLQMKSSLHYDSMTKEAFWNNFITTGWPPDYKNMIKSPDYDRALKGEKEY